MDLSRLTPEQQEYVLRRRQQLRWWNWLGWLLLLPLAGFYGWLWQNHRLYIDPFLLLDKLRAGQVSDVEIARLAALGNLAFLGCGLLLAGLILMAYAAVWSEARSIRLLSAPFARDEKASAGPSPSGAEDIDNPLPPP